VRQNVSIRLQWRVKEKDRPGKRNMGKVAPTASKKMTVTVIIPLEKNISM
jgi:hypothetical protein